MYYLSIEEYENKDIPKNHLIAEKPPWDPSTKQYLELETCMLYYLGQFSIIARGPAYVNTVISYSLAYDVACIMDDDNLVTAFSVQIHILVLIRTENHQ